MLSLLFFNGSCKIELRTADLLGIFQIDSPFHFHSPYLDLVITLTSLLRIKLFSWWVIRSNFFRH